mmetsp:Transcript_15924/g.32693  ORF Transcript_15924/g.32693 Transcript_15924/m.32693 type:complete len:849 (-) Transcript_15924:458-3004(-)
MKRKSAEEPQPDLEAHFSDGAWYDIIMLASDPSRDRFLVQAKDFPDEQEWVDCSVIRPQSQPFEKPPAVGSTVLALHRSQRSDLFFEGVVKDLCEGTHCRIQFTEGRVRGQSIKVPLDDVNRICTRKLSLQVLKSWCKNTKLGRSPSAAPQVVHFEEGEFVLIEGPDDGLWVAELMESYTGRISEEVDDVDDDGPTVRVRWLYKPSELPKSVTKGILMDRKSEIFVSYHRDTIDARLIVRKCKVLFGVDRPRKDLVFEDDELFVCRTWDPSKKRLTPLDCPTLPTDFKREIKEFMMRFPLKQTRSSGASSPSEAGKIRLEDSGEVIRCWSDAGHDEVSEVELSGGKADALEREASESRAEEILTPVGIADIVKRRSRSPVSLAASVSGEKENTFGCRRTRDGRIVEHSSVVEGKLDIPANVSSRNPQYYPRRAARRNVVSECERHSNELNLSSKSPVLTSSGLSTSPPCEAASVRLLGKRRSESPLADDSATRRGSKTPCARSSQEGRSPSEPRSCNGEDEGCVPAGAKVASVDGEGQPLALGESIEVEHTEIERDDSEQSKDGDDEDRSMADTDQLPSAGKLVRDDEDSLDASSSGENELYGEIEAVKSRCPRDLPQSIRSDRVVVNAIAVLVEEGERGLSDGQLHEDGVVEIDEGSGSASPDCTPADLSHEHHFARVDGDHLESCISSGESIDWRAWQFADCRQSSDVAAVEGFIIEAVRFACTRFLRQHQFGSVAYFLHRRRSRRELSSVGISACFKSARTHRKCQKFLRSHARKKKAMAAIVITEDRHVNYPLHVHRGGQRKSGLFVQLDSHHRRGLWHIVPGGAADCTFTKLEESESILRRLV